MPRKPIRKRAPSRPQKAGAQPRPSPKAQITPAELHEKKRKALLRQQAAERRKRSDAAKRGWQKRRKEQRQRSERARRGWRTRWFRQAREEAVNGLRGRKRADWQVLVAMITNEDPIWVAYLARADQLGFTSAQARDEWFSPAI